MKVYSSKLSLGKVFLSVLVCFSSCAKEVQTNKPNLVVLIGIDQFRASYLQEHGDVFSGGFRRLLDQGCYYEKAIVDHAPTLSNPGHATLATGTHPKKHGINANDWFKPLPNGEKERVMVFVDTSVQIVGYPGQVGVSPKNLRVTGLADWIRDSDADARSVALSTGHALAMWYGGQALPDESRNHAYWLSGRLGTFVTSTFFRSDYPRWVEDFNRNAMPKFRKNKAWISSVSEQHLRLGRVDEVSYESDGVNTTFPHVFEDGASTNSELEAGQNHAFNRWFWNSPFADEALFSLAKEAVRALALGQRNATDFLAIAIKSVDRIGHDYGPNSQEQLDILFRLDRQLGALFEFLDKIVGKNNYIVSVSADHGAKNVVEYENEQGRPGQRISEREIQGVLDGIDQFIKAYRGPEDALTERIARELERVDFIARAMTPQELSGTDPANEILRCYRNSYIVGRNTTFPLWTKEVLYGKFSDTHPVNWGIIVEFAENTSIWTARANHGTSYLYDREVPIIFMGKGIEPGVVTDPARTVDIAPTLADLAGVPFPNTVDGKVLRIPAQP